VEEQLGMAQDLPVAHTEWSSCWPSTG